MLGGLFGDFIRGRRALRGFPVPIRQGIVLHRYIDRRTDHSAVVKKLRRVFPREFRRYAGIIIDLAFDHELAKRWKGYSETSLEDFDQGVREMLAGHDSLLPERLRGFMRYADRRGLFAAYRDESEIVHSLRGVGRRLSRSKPLHRVDEIWDEFEPVMSACFEPVFEEIQSEVAAWLKSKSTISGS